jgi:hypothetical protein
MAPDVWLVVVARGNNALYESIGERLSDTGVVILDRRHGERRSQQIGVDVDRRRGERRQPLSAEADALWHDAGYVVVRVEREDR